MIRTILILSLAAMGVTADIEPAKVATADAAPLDPGACELALSTSWTTADRNRDAEGASQDRGGKLTERSVGVGVTYGIVEDFDASIGLGWAAIDDKASNPASGVGATDLELGGKWRFWRIDGENAWATALLPVVTAPMGRGQDATKEIPTASRFWTAGLTLVASGNLGIIAVNADLGYAHAFGSADSRDGYAGTMVADAALGVQITDIIQPEIELNWSRDRVENGRAPWVLAVTAGTQIGLEFGRLGIGMQRVVAGANTDETTSLLADLAISF
jgi:hypothetical protein